MKVYLAARYSRRGELSDYADDLRAIGHEVTSRWIDGRHETPPTGMAVDSTDHLGWAAMEDLEDLRDADLLIAFTEAEGAVAGRGRGGRHVELGVAIERELRVMVVGHRENVFCCLPWIAYFPDWPSALASLREG